jgi:hypothetical protein
MALMTAFLLNEDVTKQTERKNIKLHSFVQKAKKKKDKL